MKRTPDWLKPALQAVQSDDEGRVCKDIPESACREEGNNFLRHVVSLSLSKTSDGLIDPKLVLSWLMTHLGAPTALTGLLVPIRESGALLPQLITAAGLRSLPQRKWAWAAGATVQGVSAIAIAVAALFLSGMSAGVTILCALAVLAVARSVCSVCYKDVLGKTVDKSRRGTATGLAGSVAAGGVIVFALLLSSGWVDRYSLVIGALSLAGVLWILGALNFLGLKEEKGSTEGGRNALDAAMENIACLKEDPQLRRFILVRGLLTATALAPPFMIAAATGESAESYGGLGFLVLASALASLVSSTVWGFLADRSSRKVLIFSGLAGGLALGVSAGAGFAGFLATSFVLPVLLFALMLAYQGVRLGRSTHLVDMADQDTRAAYTALSNTIIGILLLAGSGFSLLAAFAGPVVVLAVMAVMCALACLVALGLEEVQEA
tara:strand:- start:250 stop:1557 length:1308 start_codon:yes stop_codon:yes gene_type:complete